MLVIAPHPDDETIGCGGLIASRAERGVRIRVLCLTDGEASLEAEGVGEREIGYTRRMEAVEAVEALGLRREDVEFWRMPDGALPGRGAKGFQTAADRLRKLIEDGGLDCVLAPHPQDGWTDHAAASELARSAVGCVKKSVKLYYYVVWGWHSATWGMRGFDWSKAVRVRIGDVKAQKRAALAVYMKDLHPGTGIPYCGRLPWAVRGLGLWRDEIFFEA